MASIEERARELMNTLPVDEPKGLVYEAYKIGATDTLKKLRLPSDDDDKLASEVRYKGVKIIPPIGFLIGEITEVDDTTGINKGMLVEFVKKITTMAKDIKAFCGYCEFAENCEKHFFECDKHEVFAEIAKDQRKIDIERTVQFLIDGGAARMVGAYRKIMEEE